MSGKMVEIKADEFESQVLKSPVPVVVDFYSTECPPCEALAAKYAALSEIYGEDIRFVKIYRQDSRTLAESLGVKGSPTVLFFRNGERVGDTLSGGIRRSAVEANLKTLITPERSRELAGRIKPVTTHTDVLILGGGPAGLTAGIYTAQAKLRTMIVDRALAGGNVAITHMVSNFPGFPEPQHGYMLAHHMVQQAKVAGVEFREAVEITGSDLESRKVVIDGVETIIAKKIIIATGTSPRNLGVKGETENKGRGVSYCATCDAKYYQGKNVVVIGGGNSAVEEAIFITKYADKVTIVHQFDKLQANKLAQEQARANSKIEFVMEHEPREFVRKGPSIGEVLVENLKTKVRYPIVCDGVFIFAGMVPNLEGLDHRFELDQWGFIQTDPEMRTNMKDIYAAGDIISKRYRQVTTAVNDGTIAAIAISKELG